MARCLNKVMIIGNLTADPVLHKISSGASVATFSVAANREFTSKGEKKDEVEFIRIVAWEKLGELCTELLKKGSKVYLEGRLKTNKFTGKDNLERVSTEVVIEEMIVLSPFTKKEDIINSEGKGEQQPTSV